MTIRHIPDLLKQGDAALGLGQGRRKARGVPSPAINHPHGTEARAWREWLAHVVGGRIGG